jgi:ferredoxin
MDFSEIREWFDTDKWDIGYLTKKQLKICSYSPIKHPSQTHGWNYVNGSSFDWSGICNGIVLIIHSEVSLDYSLYEQATEILNKHLEEEVDWGHVYTNFKEAEILSGRGVRARNSLVYNYKFGFDSKVCVIGFKEMIQNPPKIKRVAGNNFKDDYWNKCIGCDACREACPPEAIHNNEDVDWLDSAACSDFLSWSDHSRIPSIKKFWHKNVHPEVPKEIVDKVTNEFNTTEHFQWDWNAKGFSEVEGRFLYHGKEVPIMHCRECQSQAPCSKWGGKYPYEKMEIKIEEKLERTNLMFKQNEKN